MNNSPNNQITTNSYIAKDWNGGYKLELDISSESNLSEWQLNFDLPSDFKIRDSYGVDLIDNGNGNYSINGLEEKTLEAGKTTKATFVIDDNGNDALAPQFEVADLSAQSNSFFGSDSPATESATPQPSPSPAASSPSISPTSPTSPAQLSSNAISVGFEQHANNTTYNSSAQSQDWDVAWSNQMDKYASISSNEARSGNNSLQMTYPANEQSNAGAKWVIPGQKEYYLSYWVKFDDNFDFDGPKHSGGKMPGLGEGDLASGGQKPNGENGFTSRYMWREDGKATMYLYHMDLPATWGDDILLQDSNGNDKYFERGQWHNMVQRVQGNDSGQANGEIDVWMDGEQVLDMDGLRLNNGQGVDTMFFSSFHGGSGSDWWPESNQNAHFDDFVVSTDAADVGL